MIGTSTTELEGWPVTQPMRGRPDLSKPLCCLFCLREIRDDESGERLTPADESYRVVVHTACLHASN